MYRLVTSRAAPRLVRQKLRRMMATASAPSAVEQKYSGSIRAMHWAMAAGIIGCIATVQGKNYVTDKKLKGDMMFYHKSFGLLMGGAIAARIGARLVGYVPAHAPGPFWENVVANATHASLYALMVVMPVTGIAMGYYGGKGLPFFATTIPGATEKRGDIAGKAFKLHKKAGVALEVLVPLHIGAAFFHSLRGSSIMSRML